MFTEESFKVFDIEGLDNRMAAIRSEIQPIFQELNEYFQEKLSPVAGEEFFIHIAQHRRRTTHAPENTWSALSRKKRGYKMEPHFQLGIWPDYVFMWLSCIDQPKNEQAIAQKMLDEPELFTKLSSDFKLSGDHTKAEVKDLSAEAVEKLLIRFRDVKKGEFQIGRIISKDSPLWKEPEAAKSYMIKTYQQLMPIYQAIIQEAAE
ncbi:DUF1054 domain-containing protein [Candidatus Enterococcus ferrettii]|uniref:UPF0637 protein JZO67_000593 n=1 Tax=Candidatus Enterococcus ferrettii TaxID=2815324 RepID=A0ABV0EMI7_9ENTE|nr:DUF1054 domain-containing protein [Enterococcus sp. 665A]MBO1339206.1 DUF1054 domain-containing protein [Enterococcus sp. 665A]